MWMPVTRVVLPPTVVGVTGSTTLVVGAGSTTVVVPAPRRARGRRSVAGLDEVAEDVGADARSS